ncbi:MAG: oligosaccharide repeat unit polymerase [Caldilineaceae bacterium]|nr:oligosaccharide repeat unit polymerase [Caldilineaceae bacterium]
MNNSSSIKHQGTSSRKLLIVTASLWISATVLIVSMVNWPVRLLNMQTVFGQILLILCLIPFVIGVFSEYRHGLFEPVTAVSFATLYYLLYELWFNIDSFPLDASAILPLMLAYASLSLATFYLGYYIIRLRNKSQRAVSSTQERQSDILRNADVYAIIVSYIVLSAIAIWLISSGSSLVSLLAIAGAEYAEWEKPSGYLYGMRSSLTACILLLIGTKAYQSKLGRIALVLTLIIGLVLPTIMGTRFIALQTLLGLGMFYYMNRHKTVAFWHIVAATALMFLYVGVVGFYRSPSRSIGQDSVSISEVLDTATSRSSELSLTTTLVVRDVPHVVPYSWGRRYLKVLVQPIPRALWPNKYAWFENDYNYQLLRYVMGDGSSWFSWAEMYRNFGPVGVGVGSLLIGIVCAIIYGRQSRAPNDVFGQIFIALFWLFIFGFYSRHDFGRLMAQFCLMFFPWFFVKWFSMHGIANNQQSKLIRKTTVGNQLTR